MMQKQDFGVEMSIKIINKNNKTNFVLNNPYNKK